METARRDRPIVWLIIEDWRARSLLQAQLNEDGFEVLSSLSWAEALFRIERQPWPRLVAIGVDVADSLADDVLARRLAVLAHHAPVVALRGAFGPAPAWLLAMGVRAVLRRPVTIGEMCRAVRHIAEPTSVGA